MSSKKSGKVALAIGVWLVLSVVVFGSLIYVACTSNCVELIASEDGHSVDLGGVDQVPANSQLIYHGPIEIVHYNFRGYWRGPILILPE
jgi:hypothetical protein